MHLAVGGAVAKGASAKFAALVFLVLASTTAALCFFRMPRDMKQMNLVEQAGAELGSLESRAERLGLGLALAKESAWEAVEKRKAEKHGDSSAVFWPGCLFFPCVEQTKNSTETTVPHNQT